MSFRILIDTTRSCRARQGAPKACEPTESRDHTSNHQNMGCVDCFCSAQVCFLADLSMSSICQSGTREFDQNWKSIPRDLCSIQKMYEAHRCHRQCQETVRRGISLFCLLFAAVARKCMTIRLAAASFVKTANLFQEFSAQSRQCMKRIDVIANAKKWHDRKHRYFGTIASVSI